MNRLDLLSMRLRLAANPCLCRYEMVDEAGLHGLARKFGIRLFDAEVMRGLWSLGLLRADQVLASTSHQTAKLISVRDVGGDVAYCDDRLPTHRQDGYRGAFKGVSADGVKLLFHPFRVYVLYHVQRVFKDDASATQYLSLGDGLIRVAELQADSLDRWTSSESFVNRFDEWNQFCELAILLEPLFYEQVFGSDEKPAPEHVQETDQWRVMLQDLFKAIGIARINEIRSQLGRDAEMVDNNHSLQVLIRLMSAHERRKLRGDIGLTMQMLTMAELIRRAAEEVFAINLPEEDEIGSGTWTPGVRPVVYGATRVFDASRTDLRDFLASMGLDFGVKVRVYVEGGTEYGALLEATKKLSGVSLVDVRGRVAERRNDGVSFAESLRSDKVHHIFSVVVIDGDRSDFLRAVQTSTRNQDLFGQYFVSRPDFELANFGTDELVAAVVQMHGLPIGTSISDDLRCRLVLSKSADQFLREVGAALDVRAHKSRAWGQLLMRIAIASPLLPAGHPRAGEVRPIIEVTGLLGRALRSGYGRSAARAGVDPDTGSLVSKSDSN